ncbi:MAG: caspase family protein [Saprospiraceae bacterium]
MSTFTIIPQLGHGTYAVVDAIMLSEEYLLISLDEKGTLVVWETLSARQLRELNLPPWANKLLLTAEDLFIYDKSSGNSLVWPLDLIRQLKKRSYQKGDLKHEKTSPAITEQKAFSQLRDEILKHHPQGFMMQQQIAFHGVTEWDDVLTIAYTGSLNGVNSLHVYQEIIKKGDLISPSPHYTLKESSTDEQQLLYLSKDGKYLVTTTKGAGPIYLWNVQRIPGVLERKLEINRPEIRRPIGQKGNGVSVQLQNNRVFSLSLGQGLVIKERFPLLSKHSPADPIKWGWTGDKCAFTEEIETPQVFLYDENGVTPIMPPLDLLIEQMAFSAGDHFFAILHADGQFLVYDTKQAQAAKAHWRFPGAQCFTFHPKEHILVVGFPLSAGDYKVAFYDLTSADDLQVPPEAFSTLIFADQSNRMEIAFSQEGNYLILTGPGQFEILDTSQLKSSITPLFPTRKASGPQIAKGKLVGFFAPIAGSTLIFDQDQKILLENRKTRKIEIWEIAELKKMAIRMEQNLEDGQIERKTLGKMGKSYFIPPFNILLFEKAPLAFLTRPNEECIKIFNWEKEAYFGQLFLLDEKRFLLMDRFGNYYSSSDTHDLVAFLIQEEIYPIDQFDLLFNRPHIVLNQLGIVKEEVIKSFQKAHQNRLKRTLGEGLDKIDADQRKAPLREVNLGKILHDLITNNRGLMPQVEIQDKYAIPGSTDEPALDFKVTLKGKDLLRFNIYINNVPINARVRVGEEDKEMSGTKGLPLKNIGTEILEVEIINLQLSTGQNKIEVSLLNQQHIEGLRDTLYVNYQPNSSDQKSKLFLVRLAVDHYLNGPDLLFPQINMLALRDGFLKQISSPQSPFKELVLSGLRLRGADLTKDNLIEKIKPVLQNTTEQDAVIVFYAGHGIRDPETQALFLGTTEIDFNHPSDKGIPYEVLEQLLDGIPARNKLLLIDACFSGEQTDDLESFNLMKSLFVDLRRGIGATVIVSATSLQEAEEGRDLGFTVFGRSLLDGLGFNDTAEVEADEDGDGKVFVSDLLDFLEKKVPRLSKGRHAAASRAENIDQKWRLV